MDSMLIMATMRSALAPRGVRPMMSPTRTVAEGIVTRRPRSVKCPCRTSWRASAREGAMPSRYTALSSRRSSSASRFSPATPRMRLASSTTRRNWRSSTL